ncbi:MAG TPA: SCO family protein [Gammaproteobacteria bacterium]|nr:SCO family protein [Gammaproteobacteria bacterium]
MKFKVLLAYAPLLVLALAAGSYVGYLTLGHKPVAPPRTAALLLADPKPLPDFLLTDAAGTAFTRRELMGHWSLLYFGYTHCPDACPTTLMDLDHMLAVLGKAKGPVLPRVYFVSVDPKRDNLGLLRNYTLYFNPAFVGVTGELEQLRALTTPLGVDFSYQPANQTGNYTVNHSVAVFLVDPQAEETAVFTPPLAPERMAADFRAIVDYRGDL